MSALVLLCYFYFPCSILLHKPEQGGPHINIILHAGGLEFFEQGGVDIFDRDRLSFIGHRFLLSSNYSVNSVNLSPVVSYYRDVNAPRLQGGASKPKLSLAFPRLKYFSSPFTKRGIQIERFHNFSSFSFLLSP